MTKAPSGSCVDRGHTVRSSEESYDPEREREPRDAAERFTAVYAAGYVEPRQACELARSPGPPVNAGTSAADS
jgi:hypothetical protein